LSQVAHHLGYDEALKISKEPYEDSSF